MSEKLKLSLNTCQLDKVVTTADLGYKMTFALGEDAKEQVAKSFLFRAKNLKVTIEEE